MSAPAEDPWAYTAPPTPTRCPECGSGPYCRATCPAAAPCGCGYDLCGECMRTPGPKTFMQVPGLNRVSHNGSRTP